MSKRIGLIIVAFVVGGVALYLLRDFITRQVFSPTRTSTPVGQSETTLSPPDIQVVATNLAIPWEIAFLPDETMLVTERPGRLLKISQEHVVIPIEGVHHAGEGGLLGLAVHPKFSENQWIYLYMTTKEGDQVMNRVERYRLDNSTLTDRVVIIDQIPGASIHDGGRIAFGPDGLLYITVGDAGNSDRAQDTESVSGKILRLNDDGSIPADNPFGNAVYSYGHRNAQGIAWDDAGHLWASEHGQSSMDELNLIEKGHNYGWPNISADEIAPGMQSPVIQSGSDETWAPAGMAFWQNPEDDTQHLFFSGLRGESLYDATIADETVVDFKAHFREEFGRLRAVVMGPDGFLYISTSNTDGRGTPFDGDDKIIRLNPESLVE